MAQLPEDTTRSWSVPLLAGRCASSWSGSITPNLPRYTPWTAVPLSEFTGVRIGISIGVRGSAIRILIQGQEVGKLEDDAFERGLVGLVFYGKGRAIFRDLLASEACTPHRQ